MAETRLTYLAAAIRQDIQLNREALARLSSEKELAIVPGATHLFEEPCALAEIARLAGEWFGRHLARIKPRG